MAKRIRDKAHLAKVAQLPCCVCGNWPVEVHHIRQGVGMSQRAGDRETIPLCQAHHRTGGFGVAFHAGPREFQSIYGTERELLEKTLALLDEQS